MVVAADYGGKDIEVVDCRLNVCRPLVKHLRTTSSALLSA